MQKIPAEWKNALSLGTLLAAMWTNPWMVSGQPVVDYVRIVEGQSGFTGILDGAPQFGSSVAAIGDLDGDGVEDLVVGAPRSDDVNSDSGSVWVLFMTQDGLVRSFQEISNAQGGLGTTLGSWWFGSAVSPIGDLDDDGVIDLAVGAMKYGGKGAVLILLMRSDGTVKGSQLIADGVGGFDGSTLFGVDTRFGNAVTGLGDLNGDGIEDIAVGAPIRDLSSTNNANWGAVFVLFLNASGTVASQTRIDGHAPYGHFGSSVCYLGDLNGDTLPEIAVGANTTNDGGSQTGAVWIVSLNVDGSPSTQQQISASVGGFGGTLPALSWFGTAVAATGDTDGDGIGDLVVGAPGVGSASGAVWLLLLNADGTVKAEQQISNNAGGLEGQLVLDAQFGAAVASFRDLNGGGSVDLAVGQPLDPTSGTEEGAAWILFLDEPPRLSVVEPPGAAEWPVGALRAIRWVNGEGLASVLLSVDGGLTFDVLQSGVSGGEFLLRVPHAPTRFGVIRVEQSTPFSVANSDSFFTISSDISLLRFSVVQTPGASSETRLSWATHPGADDLAGYRLEKSVAGSHWETLVQLTRATEFVDADGSAGGSYRLFAVNGLGGELLVRESSAVSAGPLSAWPMPFSGVGELTIRFASAGGLGGGPGATNIDVFDVRGRKVRSLLDARLQAGYHTVSWDGRDESSLPVSSGLYFVKTRSAGIEQSLKVMVTR